MSTPREQWAAYEKANEIEVKLVFDRLNAMLQSQSVLVAAAAFLYAGLASEPKKQAILVSGVACVGLVTALLALTVIALGCMVLRRWHDQARSLAEKYGSAQLEGLYLKKRGRMPDWIHIISIDFFGCLMPFTFACSWALLFLWIHGIIV